MTIGEMQVIVDRHVPIIDKNPHPMLAHMGIKTTCAKCETIWPCDARRLIDVIFEIKGIKSL